MDNAPINQGVQYLAPEITEERVWNYKNLGLVIFLGVIIIGIAILILTLTELSITYKIILAWILTIIYAAVLFFALEPRILRQVKETAVRTIIQPVEKKVFIERPVEKPIERKVFVEKPKEPEYDYVGSTETGTYHKAGCKFSKLIKPEFKRVSNDPYDFQSKGFKRCRACFGLRKRRRKTTKKKIPKPKKLRKKTSKKKKK